MGLGGTWKSYSVVIIMTKFRTLSKRAQSGRIFELSAPTIMSKLVILGHSRCYVMAAMFEFILTTNQIPWRGIRK